MRATQPRIYKHYDVRRWRWS